MYSVFIVASLWSSSICRNLADEGLTTTRDDPSCLQHWAWGKKMVFCTWNFSGKACPSTGLCIVSSWFLQNSPWTFPGGDVHHVQSHPDSGLSVFGKIIASQNYRHQQWGWGTMSDEPSDLKPSWGAARLLCIYIYYINKYIWLTRLYNMYIYIHTYIHIIYIYIFI